MDLTARKILLYVQLVSHLLCRSYNRTPDYAALKQRRRSWRTHRNSIVSRPNLGGVAFSQQSGTIPPAERREADEHHA